MLVSRIRLGALGKMPAFQNSRSSAIRQATSTGMAQRHGAGLLCAMNHAGARNSLLQHNASAANRNRAQMTQNRGFDWALRPYAASQAAHSVPLETLSAGFSKVGLSLMVAPWNALPAVGVIALSAFAVPAMWRMMYTNSSRGATANVYNFFLNFTLSFMPTPCFEHLFGEMAFYGFALFATFFVYNFFPEILLNEYIIAYYTALLVIPLFPLAFTYMPLYAGRAYLFL